MRISVLGSARHAARDPKRLATQPLRRRITRTILAITAAALCLFGLPLGFAVDRLYRGDELARLQRDATAIVARISDNPVTPTIRVGVPGDVPDRTIVGIYSPAGRRVGGEGPSWSAAAAASGDGRVHQVDEAEQVAVAVPVPSDRRVVAVVRAAALGADIRQRVITSWAAMAVLGCSTFAITAALTRRQARRIAEPLERLTVAARSLGDGDFTIVAERSGVEEADRASAALADTAARIGRLVSRERSFSADASHQLRTPLTGLLLGLESALQRPGADLRAASHDALDRGRQLNQTIDDLLTLGRDTSPAGRSTDLGAEIYAVLSVWREPYGAAGRDLVVHVPSVLPPARTSPGTLRQVLGVLLENALEHGSGTVTITVNDIDDVIAIDVGDQGQGLQGDPDVAFARRTSATEQHGIGLSLARSLTEAEGGRLVLRRAAPAPIFTVLLPAASAVVATRLERDAGDPPQGGSHDRAPS